MWSTHFNCEVDNIEGENIEGPRIIVRHNNGKTVELPSSWVKVIQKTVPKNTKM